MEATWTSTIFSAAISIFVGIVSGWVGGHLGVRRALSQKRSEELMQRRIAWADEFRRTLLSLRDRISEMRIGIRRGESVNAAEFNALLGGIPELVDKLAQVGRDSTMYFDRVFVSELTKLMGPLLGLYLDLAESGETLDRKSSSQDQVRKRIREITEVLDNLRIEVETKLREELQPHSPTRVLANGALALLDRTYKNARAKVISMLSGRGNREETALSTTEPAR